MDVERTMEFILDMQAKHEAGFAEMRENQIQLQKFQLRQEAAQAAREAAMADAQAKSEIANQLLRERIATALVNMIDNMDASDKKLTSRMNDIAVAHKALEEHLSELVVGHKVLEEQLSQFSKETRARLNRVENGVDDLRRGGR